MNPINDTILGIDPGLTGAMVLIEGDEILEIHDMPVVPRRNGKGSEVSASLLADIVYDLCPGMAVIEQVGAMPGQGVTSMFSMGRSFGVVIGVLAGMQIRTDYVRPQKWKKHFGLIGKDKDAARTLVLDRWPESSHDFRLKKHQGRADAALIAEWGRGNAI